MPQELPPGFQLDPKLSQQMGVPVAVNPTTGKRIRMVGASSKGQVGDASLRGRLAMGMGPMVDAQERMATAERSGNPLQRDWGAALVDKIPGLDDVAKFLGGEDYQEYQQAGKTFESQLMPIMSGAAVSPSEAERQIKASLPQMGDGPKNLQAKARTRQMMLNGAAKAAGQPLPYPNVPTYGVNSNNLSSPGTGQQKPPQNTQRQMIDINGRPIK